MKAYKNYSQSIIMPQIIQLKKNLFCLAFKNMKLLPARFMITEAIKNNQINSKSTVIETSSGNFALGLAITCQEFGLNFHIVSDPAIDSNLNNRITDLGGVIKIVNKDVNGNFQESRLNFLKKLINEERGKYFWTKQYDNPDNPLAYYPISEKILECFGSNVSIVGAVGSGGSTGGIIKYLRQVSKGIELIGVDTFKSVLFGLEDGPRTLRGLGNSIMPKNLDQSLYDQIHWVTAKEAFNYTRYLHNKKGLFLGPTSGASYMVANWIAIREPNKNIVFISPDDGSRYLSNIYCDEWLSRNNIVRTINSSTPTKIEFPENRTSWSYCNWNRTTKIS